MTKIGIVLFCIVVLAGPLYTVEEYSYVSNTISELGAQNTIHNYIMIAGFLLLGIGIIADGTKKYSTAMLPFLFFALFVALAGIFPHKPIDINTAFNPTINSAHKILATVAGVAITVGFIWQGIFFNKKVNKILCFYLAAACLVFPLLMLLSPEYQGLIQRLMYLQVFMWLWFYFPEKIMANKANPADRYRVG